MSAGPTEIRMMQGNEACAEGAIAAGLRFFAGYPITPSSEIAEVLAERLPQVGGVFIQMEDEIASMGAIIGASLAGAKVMTATSGPGFSLKQENLGFASLTEIPCVIVDSQRVGPSSGMPTSPAQGDVMQARWGTHGDHPVVVVAPSSVRECFDLTVKAFNIAEELRVPVVILADEVISHMREKVEIPDPSALKVVSRKKPACPPKDYLPYGTADGDVPPMAAFGEGYRFHVTGLYHDQTGFPTGKPAECDRLIRRLLGKIENRAPELMDCDQIAMDDAEIAIFAYGSVARSAQRAASILRAEGVKIGLLRPAILWPFPDAVVEAAAKRVRAFVVPELNAGQLIREVRRCADGNAAVHGLARLDGELITPGQIVDRVREI